MKIFFNKLLALFKSSDFQELLFLIFLLITTVVISGRFIYNVILNIL